VSLVARQRDFIVMVGELIRFATGAGYGLRGGDLWRSTDKLKCPSCQERHSYQELLKFNGRSQTLKSEHGNRLAVDFEIERLDGTPMDSAAYDHLGSFWESQGGRWGGRWKSKDFGHFEMLGSV